MIDADAASDHDLVVAGRVSLFQGAVDKQAGDVQLWRAPFAGAPSQAREAVRFALLTEAPGQVVMPSGEEIDPEPTHLLDRGQRRIGVIQANQQKRRVEGN